MPILPPKPVVIEKNTTANQVPTNVTEADLISILSQLVLPS